MKCKDNEMVRCLTLHAEWNADSSRCMGPGNSNTRVGLTTEDVIIFPNGE